MSKSNLVTQKINELVKLAQQEGDSNAAIVLLGLSAARSCDDDGFFAENVQELIKGKMIPRLKDINSSVNN